MNIIMKNVDDLIPYEKNAKRHDKRQITNVAESITQYGFVQPIVIDTNDVVVIGHCRLLAAKQLKIKNAPCVCVDDLTEDQVRALRLVDNKSNESPWDTDVLFDELIDLDVSDFSFDWDIRKDEDALDLDEETALQPEQERDNITVCHCPKCGFVFEVKK